MYSCLLRYLAAFSINAFCCIGTLAQGYRTEAALLPDQSLAIPALKFDDKFYDVRLSYQAPSWVLSSANEIFPVDDDYVTGTYANDLLDLACVYASGSYYSAQLVNTVPASYSFTLASVAELDFCPIPAGIGPVRGEWKRTAEAPLSARNDASIGWTGKEIIVVGGHHYFCPPNASCLPPSDAPFADGAAYDPTTDSWRRIADAPAGLAGSNTITVGSDVLLLALTGSTASSWRLLRYRAAQDRWDQFDLPESATGRHIAAFGNAVVLYSHTYSQGSTVDWSFDTTTLQWSPLPADPLGPGYSREYVAFGGDLYLFDKALVDSPGGADGPAYLRAARLRGLQWDTLPVSDSIGSAPTLVAGQRLIAPVLGCADGGRTNGYGRCIPYGAVFDTATDSWHELPNAPGRGLKYFPSSGGLSDNGLVLNLTGRPALDAATNEWFILPPLDAEGAYTQRPLRAAGPYGFAFGGAKGFDEMLKDAWIWTP